MVHRVLEQQLLGAGDIALDLGAVVFQMTSILGLANSRSWRIFEARKLSRRWIR
jgi:hypothetical protein